MRRPRKPVPPNTVTIRPFVTTMTQIRQYVVGARNPPGRIEQSFAMMKSFTGSVAVGRSPLNYCFFAGAPGSTAATPSGLMLAKKYQRLVAWVSPLVHEGVRFIDQGARFPCLCLTA